MHVIAQAVFTATTSPPTVQAFTAAQSLTLLLTTESLLFAAFNVGLAFALPVATERNISKTGAYWLAFFAAACLTFVASGAFVAWWQVFENHWPDGFLRPWEAVAAAVGICVQPVVSFIAVQAIRP